MMQLTDAMIEEVLQETVYTAESMIPDLVIFGAVILLFAFFAFKAKHIRLKFAYGIGALLLVVCCAVFVFRETDEQKIIQNGKWVVWTDTVDRVMEETKRDRKSYFMILEKYGRVSLDDYEDAMQYYSGAKVYVVVFIDDGSIVNTGITYPADTYVYVGSH